MCTAGNAIRAEGASALAEALKVPNGSLVTLDLSGEHSLWTLGRVSCFDERFVDCTMIFLENHDIDVV